MESSPRVGKCKKGNGIAQLLTACERNVSGSAKAVLQDFRIEPIVFQLLIFLRRPSTQQQWNTK